MVKTQSLSGPHAVDIHVGRRVWERRISLGYSQSDLARALGLTFQQVQKYEKGMNRISASKLWEAASFLTVSVSYFFEGLEDFEAADDGMEFADAPTRHSLEIRRLAPRLSTAQQKLALVLLRELAGKSDEA